MLFSIRNTEKWKILSLVVFLNPQMTAMHGSLTLCLFPQPRFQRRRACVGVDCEL
jgi:hypothetical protein